jgi:YidC/Oxa1 family membrane protein insertase
LAIIPEKIKDTEIRIKAFEVKTKEDEGDIKKNKSLNFNLLYKVFASGKKELFWLYAGPSQLTELKSYEIGLQKVLFRGYGWFFRADLWFPAVCEFVLWLLIQLQKGVKDYGVVIIILTIILRIVTYPLTQSSMKSMNKMKEVQPRLNKIREKYKGNPKLMNQKMMDFYRNEGINPLGGMSGCFPMILQMPIMISLFIVLRKAIELRGQGTFLIPWVDDLSQAEVLFPLGFNVPLYGSNVALLPIIMAVLMYFQNKATIKDPNQKAMIYFMPIMMLVLFNNFPSGLCLYFTFSTALQVIQQFIMDRKKKAAS